MISSRVSEKGFSLIEILMTISLLSALALTMVLSIGNTDDAEKIEQTRAKMEAIRTAIFGNDFSTDADGKRNHFGFFGDTGSLPSTLADLVTKPASMQTWIFDTLHGFGSGWRGPYLASTIISGDKPYDTDAWGTQFIYSLAATPSLTSYGSNKAAGGTIYAQDLVMQFPATMRLATVRGILSDFDAPRSSYVVSLGYPSGASAAITTATSTTNAQGFFSFVGVPFGVRSLRVTSPTTQPARNIVVDRSDINITPATLNYFGSTEAVTSVRANPHSNVFPPTIVTFFLTSSYSTIVQLDAVTVTYNGTGSLTSVTLNGVRESFSGVASGVQKDLSAKMTLSAREKRVFLELGFSAALNWGNPISVVLYWVGRTKTDTISGTVEGS